MRKKLCCEASRHLYENYYVNQSGNGLPVIMGYSGQRGHGLGSLLSGLFRRAMPLLKGGLATFGKHALKTGLEIANDVVEGDTLKASAKRRVPEGIKQFARAENFIGQTGSGRKRSRKRGKRKLSTKHKNINRGRKKMKDIFE